jgi:hypothetical protein
MTNYYGSYDVVVCGGGTSGIAAALAAARDGAKTLLIERVGQIGGQMCFSGPPGFSYAWLYNARGERIIGGIVWETYQRLLKEGHAMPEHHQKWRGAYQFSLVDPDWWGLLMYDLLEEAGCELMLHTVVTDVIRKGSDIRGVICEHPGGQSMVLAKVVIDCTGEGEIAYRAGAETEIWPKDKLEPSTVAFTADGVDWDKFMDYFMNHLDEFDFNHVYEPYVNLNEEEVKREIRRNVKSIADVAEVMGFVSLKEQGVKTGEWHNMSGVGFFIMPREGGVIQAHFQHSSQVDKVDCTDVRDLTYCETECRKQDEIAFKFFKKYVPGFENIYLTRMCPEVRIRETRRVMGDYVMTPEDVGEARRFPDTIGRSNFPAGAKHVVPGADATTTGTVTSSKINFSPKGGGSNDIPYRCMVVKGLENFLVAGKAVSATRPAHQRFLQETMVTGEAAGTAAALCTKEGITPRQLEDHISKLQDKLRSKGVILEGVH